MEDHTKEIINEPWQLEKAGITHPDVDKVRELLK
jgi:hypothetical protein